MFIPQRASAAGAISELPASAETTQTTDEADIELRLAAIAEEGVGLRAAEARQRQAPADDARRDEVLIIGSSSVRGMLGRVFVQRFTELGYAARRIGESASGLARLDFHDWISAVDELPVTSRTLAVLVYVGVNDPQGLWLRPDERASPRQKWWHWRAPEWAEVYRARVTEMVNSLCARGVPHVIFLTPADVRWHSLQQRLSRIRRLQIEGARQSECGHAMSSSGDSLYIYGPDESEQPRRLRDGYHMTTYGAQLVFDRIRPRLLRLLGRPRAEASTREPD